MTYNSKSSFSSLLASFAVAFFIDIKCINYIMRAMLNIDEEGGFMSLLYIIVSISLLGISLLQKNSIFKIDKYVVFILVFILAWYQYTDAMIGVPRVPFLILGVFTLVAFITPSIVQINPKTYIKAVMLLPSLGVLYSSNIFSTQDSASETISMQISYAFLVPVMATIIYLKKYYRQESRFWKRIGGLSVFINAIYGYQILSLGSRGPFLCIISLLIYFILFKKREDGSGVIIKKSNASLIMILVFFTSLFLIDILTFLSSSLHSFGIDLNVINKNIRMIAEGDMSNGREYIAGLTIQEFTKNPIFGYGLDQFENNTGIGYPHNFVLQILYDGGLFFFVILLIPVIYKLYTKIKTCDENEYFLIPFFFFVSVPGALLSADLWYNERLWIFFGVVFASHFIGNMPNENKACVKYGFLL